MGYLSLSVYGFAGANGFNNEALATNNAQHETFNFSSVSEALAMLSKRSDLQILRENGVTTFYDSTEYIFWSFPSLAHPAYPAVVKQTVLRKDGTIYIQTEQLCEAQKDACDALAHEYQERSQKVREKFQHST